MEIVVKGYKPSEQKYIGKCKTCSSVIRFTKSEATIYTDWKSNYMKIECPVCHETITKDL